MQGGTISLKKLTESDVVQILQWSPYPAWVSPLDYALRKGGWLDQFQESESSHRYSAWQNFHLVGFSILTGIKKGDAEFYVAIHPEHLGCGIGKDVTRGTIRIAFEQLKLSRVHLKVRLWHDRAIRLYESVGFKRIGTCVETIEGQPVQFITMEIVKEAGGQEMV